MTYENSKCRRCREAGEQCSPCRIAAIRDRARLRREGLCAICRKRPARIGTWGGKLHTTCEPCASRLRAHTRETQPARIAKYREEGVCIICGGDRDEDALRCRSCLDKQRVASFRYRHPDVELEPCGEPLPEIAVSPAPRLDVLDSLARALSRARLSRRQLRVLDLRVGITNRVPMTWADIGTAVGLSREGARIAFLAALSRLGADPGLLSTKILRA